MHVGEAHREESDHEKLLGIHLDKKLSFKKHVQALCKTSQKLHAFTRIQFECSPRN